MARARKSQDQHEEAFGAACSDNEIDSNLVYRKVMDVWLVIRKVKERRRPRKGTCAIAQAVRREDSHRESPRSVPDYLNYISFVNEK